MTSPLRQETRVGALETPCGPDALALTRFDAIEGVSELFEFRIEAITTDPGVKVEDAIGKNCSVRFNAIGGGKRWFDGILTQTHCLGTATRGTTYQLILRPWLWVLSKRRRNRIFHEMTVAEIIMQVFDDYGSLASHEVALTNSYPKLEYCVQYQESDMDFVRRLMEHNGINFYFRHDKGEHKLVWSDSFDAAQAIPGETRPFYDISERHNREKEHFFHWEPVRRFTTGKYAVNDYDFKKPGANLRVEKTGDAEYQLGKLESYEHPGKFLDEGVGNARALARINMERAADRHFMATGDCVTCYPGARVTLTDHHDREQNKEYVALRCTHAFAEQAYFSVAEDSSGEVYQGSYEFVRADRPYAPPIVTAKPRVHGPQTARVVGNGEIFTDEYGRIKVRFHWDHDDSYSMWCRVAQVWAGKQWGAIFIPRVGMEVVCDFLEGDPDQPIVIGCVYNADNMPPFALDGSKNIAGWKSNSTEGGGGYNEMVLDDTQGKELIRIHAQYDLDATVEHDERRTVGKNRTTSIGVNEQLDVGNNRDTSIGKNDTLDVGKQLHINVGDQITITCGASKIVMKKNGDITINGKDIKLTATAKITNKATRASYKAAADLEVKGAMVKINS